jgi:rhamnose utilization protein RhaD (predicted bifunctional aldolase and dehydrogenase)/NAD(P)-dependent dehydrogenase (short-subunit alcohol dehydrogenase family)
MKSLWSDKEAKEFADDLGLRVYTSRLLGRDPSLVLHGGGNTSVKIREQNILGEDEDILYVKGSGWDLETIEAAGFAPVRMQHMIKLAGLPSMTDLQMVNELRTNMTLASAPTPSVETILHAILPYKYVDHTHADAVVTVTNTANGEERIREIYGDSVVVIPYIMPGFDLARLCAERFAAEAGANTIGMVLMNHGIFSFADSAKESYVRMIDLVNRAEDYLKAQNAWDVKKNTEEIELKAPVRHDLSELRQQLSRVAGFPCIVSTHQDIDAMEFIYREDLREISQQGPATPDHVIRTKRLPLLGKDVDAYAKAYAEYFLQHKQISEDELTMLDPAPRVVLDKDMGFSAVGRTAKDAAAVADIYRHTMRIIQRSTMLGGFKALPASDIFAVEYWELEQAKLRKGGKPLAFTGEIALVTGAASGIGKACVQSLLQRGAAVVGLDLNMDIVGMFDQQAYLGIQCDVSDENQLEIALEQTVTRFGGLDMLILNAGIFPGGCDIADLDMEEWHKVMRINLDANLVLMRLCYPLLKCAPVYGRVVVIGSRNVTAPGPGAAAYSASKAALNQLARIAALEWGADRIRINTLHPDAVFDTGIWTEQVLRDRAQHYGMTVEEYKTRNILKTEVSSFDVAELAAEMCGPLFARTTAAQVPIDGGNDRVI